MTTFVVLRTRMANELMARSDLTSEINAAILSAIAFYQRKSFYFTEARTTTFSTVDGQEFYSSSDLAAIATLPGIDQLTITVDGQPVVLGPRTFADLEAMASTSEGRPVWWAYYARQIRFSPIPDAVYTIRAASDPRLTTLSADGDTNVWTTEAEELIRSRAKADVFANVLYDTEKAAVCKGQEAEQYDALLAETRRRKGSNVLRTDFAGLLGGGSYDITRE